MLMESAAAKVAAALIAGGAATGVGVSVADCPTGQEMTVVGCAKVTHHSDDSGRGTGSHSATTVSVYFRDADGNKTDSGLGPGDQFEWLGGKKMGKNGDGMLVEIRQTTTGKGGWGSLYEGWIPMKYTQTPRLFED